MPAIRMRIADELLTPDPILIPAANGTSLLARYGRDVDPRWWQQCTAATAIAQVRQRWEREREAAVRAALVARCEERLAVMDSASIDKLQAKAAAASNAYVAAMAAHNEQIRDELQALGSDLPGDVDTGSYANGYGVTVGDVVVRRERLQTNHSRLAKDVLRSHITRGEISLDQPRD